MKNNHEKFQGFDDNIYSKFNLPYNPEKAEKAEKELIVKVLRKYLGQEPALIHLLYTSITHYGNGTIQLNYGKVFLGEIELTSGNTSDFIMVLSFTPNQDLTRII